MADTSETPIPPASPRGAISPLARAGSFIRSSFENFFSNRPERDEKVPLTVFYHATHQLKRAVRALESARTEGDQIIAIERLHKCQTDVLNALETVFADVNDPRQSREYRLKFPAEVQEELQCYFWETLLFAAELIADGRVLEGRERATEMLRPSALELCEAFETINRVLRSQARRDPHHYSTKVRHCLRYFDTAWATFENLYVRAVVPCTSSVEYEQRQEMTVLFSEGVMRGLRSKTITQEMIDDYEPQVMFAIPRLAVMTGLLLNAEPLESYRWLSNDVSELREIRAKISQLSDKDVKMLEKALAEGAEDVNVNTNPEVHDLFRLISALSDRMQQGEHRKEFRDIMSTLFKMYQDHPLLDTHYAESIPEESEDQSNQPSEGATPSTSTKMGRGRATSTSSHHDEFLELSKTLAEQSEEARAALEAQIGPVGGSYSVHRRDSAGSIGRQPEQNPNLLNITITNLGLNSIEDDLSQSSQTSLLSPGITPEPSTDFDFEFGSASAVSPPPPPTSQSSSLAAPSDSAPLRRSSSPSALVTNQNSFNATNRNGPLPSAMITSPNGSSTVGDESLATARQADRRPSAPVVITTTPCTPDVPAARKKHTSITKVMAEKVRSLTGRSADSSGPSTSKSRGV